MADVKTTDGEYGPTVDATPEIQEICYQLKSAVEVETGVTYQKYTAIVYCEDGKGPTNYLIKVHVGGPEYIHLIIFSNGGSVSLTRVKQKETKDSPLVPF